MFLCAKKLDSIQNGQCQLPKYIYFQSVFASRIMFIHLNHCIPEGIIFCNSEIERSFFHLVCIPVIKDKPRQ